MVLGAISIETRLSVRPGATVAGRYRIDQLLGVGANSVVLVAEDIVANRLVAVKVVEAQTEKGASGVLRRFEREHEASVVVHSDYIERLFDVGLLGPRRAYRVSEYLEGQDLERWIADSGAFPLETAIDLVVKACEGLGQAHATGHAHGSLEPASLFVVRGPNEELDIRVRHLGSAVGAEPIDDIRALASILVTLIVGRMPDRNGPSELELPASTPRALVRAIDSARNASPTGEITNMAELAVRLSPFGTIRTACVAQRVKRGLGEVLSSRPPPPAPTSTPRRMPQVQTQKPSTSAVMKKGTLLGVGPTVKSTRHEPERARSPSKPGSRRKKTTRRSLRKTLKTGDAPSASPPPLTPTVPVPGRSATTAATKPRRASRPLASFHSDPPSSISYPPASYPPPPFSPPPTSDAPDSLVPAGVPSSTPRRRMRWLGVMVLGLFCAGGLYAWLRSTRPTGAAAVVAPAAGLPQEQPTQMEAPPALPDPTAPARAEEAPASPPESESLPPTVAPEPSAAKSPNHWPSASPATSADPRPTDTDPFGDRK